MNRYKASIDDRKQEELNDARAMLVFCAKIATHMGLTPKEIHSAANMNMTWDTRSFTLAATHRRSCDDWRDLIIATPKKTANGKEIGYSNNESGAIPDGWTFHPKGTCTIFYPHKKAIQDRILKEIIDEA